MPLVVGNVVNVLHGLVVREANMTITHRCDKPLVRHVAVLHYGLSEI